MTGQLSSLEIESLLYKQNVGRIICHDDHETVIFPASYAYDGNFIYCHVNEENKLRLMRKNPKVCFEIDEFENISNWKSVVIGGEYEELSDKEKKSRALRILSQRNLQAVSCMNTHFDEIWPFSATNDDELNKMPGVTLRILPKEKSGEFEVSDKTPFIMFT